MDLDKKHVESINKNMASGLQALNNAKIKFLFTENCEPVTEKIFLDSDVSKNFVDTCDTYLIEPQKYLNADECVLGENYIKLSTDVKKYLYIPFKENSYTNGYIQTLNEVLGGLELLATDTEIKSSYKKETKKEYKSYYKKEDEVIEESKSYKKEKLDKNSPDYFQILEKNILLSGKTKHKDKKVSKVAKEILKYRKIEDILKEYMKYTFMNDEIYTAEIGLFVSYNYFKKNKNFFTKLPFNGFKK